MNNTFFTSLLIICLGSKSIIGQPINLEIWSGLSTYQGDIKTNFFSTVQQNPSFGLGCSFILGDHIIATSQIKWGKLEGDDKFSTDPVRQQRNLNFSTSLLEWSNTIRASVFSADKRIFPYIEMGIGLFHFNPYTFDASGNKVYLNPLGTEGQGLTSYPSRRQYSLTQFCIPLGIGVNSLISESISIFINAGWRKTFTDYIDDISKTYADPNDLLISGQKSLELAFRSNELNPSLAYPTSLPRGNSKNMDGYFFTGIGMSIKCPGNKKRVGGNGKERQVVCPIF